MSAKKIKRSRADLTKLRTIRSKIASMGFVCSGTLAERWITCGKPNCRCATNSAARHGPYYQWGRMEEGLLVQKTISPDEVEDLRKAISNHREILVLLKDWERETVAILLGG